MKIVVKEILTKRLVVGFAGLIMCKVYINNCVSILRINEKLCMMKSRNDVDWNFKRFVSHHLSIHLSVAIHIMKIFHMKCFDFFNFKICCFNTTNKFTNNATRHFIILSCE